MTTSRPRRAAIAAASAQFVVAAASLSSCATPSACTDGPIYLLDNTTTAAIPSGTRLDWDDRDGVVLSSTPIPAELGDASWATFAPADGASDVVAFVAAPGAERSPGDWKQWGDAEPISTGVLLPSVWPGYLGYGNPAGVRAAGGTYSMGIAYTDGAAVASAHVLRVYYTTITVDAGAGTWSASDPATCAATPGQIHS